MTHRTMRAALLGAAAAIAGTGALTTAQAESLRLAHGWPPNTAAAEAFETYAEKAGELSGGDIEVKLYPLSLLNFLEANEGVRDGMADIVTILTPYFQNEFPRVNLVTELAGLMQLRDDAGSRGPMIFTGALMEYVMLHCEECDAELAQQNQVYTSAAASRPTSSSASNPSFRRPIWRASASAPAARGGRAGSRRWARRPSPSRSTRRSRR